MTSPADIIEFVLKDMGVAAADIDATTFGTAKATYTSWGLTLNGAYFYKMPREQALAMLLNMCHSVLLPREKLELHVLSKTSQWTLNKSHILQRGKGESSFDYNLMTQEKSDSGYIGYQVVNMPQDNLIKAIVPAKATTDEILDEMLDVSWINDSQDAQRAGSLYYQRKLLKKSNNHFNSKGTLLALDPDDMITIDHADYGGTYDILINTIAINRDAVMSFKGIRYSDDLDDWGDLSPGAISIATDDSGNVWASVTYGPSSSVSSGDNPNQIGDGFFAGKTDLWGGNVALNNVGTKIVLGDLDATPKIALGASADAITHAGTEQGFYADGDGKVRFGDADGYVKFTPGSPSTFDIKGVLTASEIHDTWWGCTETNFNADNDNATAYILKNGVAKFQNVILDSSVTISDIQAGSEIAIQGWQHDIVFSSTDANTVSWASGTITLMSGATYNISAGNTGNMAARTYIYLDIGTSSTVLQMTTTASTAVGSGKILIGVAQNSTQQATFQIFGGIGGLTITGGDIENLSITAGEIATDAIETAKLAADAVTAAKIAVSGLDGTSGDVATNHIIAGMLQANCVTSAKVLADAITAAKIAVSGLDGTSGDVATNHIIAGMLQANCVTSVKILADAVTAAKINVVGLDGTSGRIVVADATDANVVTGGINSHAVTLINAGKILVSGGTVLSDWSHASDATLIDGGDIYTNSVTATQIAANTITAAEIFAGTIGTTEIAADAVTATKINVVGLNGTSGRIVVADATDANVVTGGINSHAVTLINAGKILISGAAVLSDWSHATDATLIDGGEIYTNSVTASQIAANTITANEIAANTITAGEIAAGTITLSEINYVPFVPATDDLDDISDGTSYGRVALTSITAGQIILTAGVTGSLPVANSDAKCTDANADQTSANTAANAAAYTGAAIGTTYTAAKCTDANADQTSANNQAVAWLTDAGNLATLNTVNATYIDAGSITLVKCAAETTNRQFTSDANRTNIEAWRHASDATLIDGGDIYANSISVNKITSSFNPNLIPSRFADFERFDSGDTLPVGNGTAAIDNTASFVGVQSLKMVASAANNYSFLGISSTDYNVTLEPSTKYILSLYAKCGAGWTPDIKVEIKQDDTTLKLSAAQEITPSWVRYTFELTTDAGLTDAGLVVLHNMDSGATIWWDAVQIEKANAAASPEASRWTPGTLNGSQFGNLTITAGKLAINTTDALEIQAAGNVLVKQGGDIVMEGGASGNPSLLRFADEAVPGEIRLEQSGDASKYWQITKGTAFDDLIVKPIGLNTPYAWFGTSTNRIGAFYVHSSAVCRFYVAGVSSLIIYNTSLTAGVDLKPNGHKTLDIGSATAAYDIMFSDDFTNVADFYQFDDRDDLAALHQIKGSGIIDPLTGYELINDSTLPAWLLKKHNKDGEVRDEDDNIISTYKRGDDCRDPDGKPYLSLKTMISLCMGAIRQLDKKMEAIKQ
jgi:hypothetical protein